MDTLARKAFQSLTGLFFAMAALLFGVPWTFDYWQAWVFLAVYFAASILITIYLMKNDQRLLERRMRGGPWAEKEAVQKVIMLFAMIGFVALLVVPAFDRRFAWSQMPNGIAIAGDALVVLGWYAIYRVFRENSFTSATIELAKDQNVISSGPYSLVRHPMYTGTLAMLVGIPIALGSWWGLVAFGVMMLALIWRIFDEERFLVRNLTGYAVYKEKVRYRLIPYLW